MKALATLKNLDSNASKDVVVRNLSRILNIRIIDVDIEQGVIGFLYNNQKAFDQVKKELNRIGHPIQSHTNQFSKKAAANRKESFPIYQARGRKPYPPITWQREKPESL
ncbi:hypothetical protein [Zobellia nedashkovskayae]|uniref:hypothetical protein n=1 Tax=Zobellia nedashkovskayae TaxID=2779510 RepID=UPI00188CD098|nr:hypothetical protein [Zobellia nedashkovskayae]